MVTRTSWIYLSFQDDNHQLVENFDRFKSWIYLSFQDDNHHGTERRHRKNSWIYLSFQDDNHPINNNCLLYN